MFWIVDNGSCHRAAASVKRLARAWPNAHLIHLPKHASWLDQAEIYFSVVQRKALTPNDFTSLAQIRDRLAAFETRYNAIAGPESLLWRAGRSAHTRCTGSRAKGHGNRSGTARIVRAGPSSLNGAPHPAARDAPAARG